MRKLGFLLALCCGCSPSLGDDGQWVVGTYSSLDSPHAEGFAFHQLRFFEDGTGEYSLLECSYELVPQHFRWEAVGDTIAATPPVGESVFGGAVRGVAEMTLRRAERCSSEGYEEFSTTRTMSSIGSTPFEATYFRVESCMSAPHSIPAPPDGCDLECGSMEPRTCDMTWCDGALPQSCD